METKQNNYLPFDLETALKHPERVVTRDGRKVSELHYFKTASSMNYETVAAVVDGSLSLYYDTGKFVGEPHHKDLFLLPEVKECWLNIYVWKSNGEFAVVVNNSQEEANAQKEATHDLYDFIKTIRVDTSLC